MKDCHEIKHTLYPKLYKKEHIIWKEDGYLLSRRQRFGRYAVLCIKKSELSDIKQIINDSKEIIRKKLKAFPWFSEVGAFIIIKTDKEIDTLDKSQIKVDLTAVFKSVIIQGVCIISSQCTKPIYKLSNWGGVTFGDCDLIVDLIEEKINM